MNVTVTKTNAFLIAGLLIFIAAITRIIPHLSISLRLEQSLCFPSATFKDKRWAYFFLHRHDNHRYIYHSDFTFSILPVYACFALSVALGTLIKNKPNAFNVIGLSLISSTIFFLVTNLPIWYADMSCIQFHGQERWKVILWHYLFH